MSSIWADLFNAAILFTILLKVTPILLAAIGGAFTSQADILNIGLEGNMLIGAFTAVAVGSATQSSLVGVLAAVGASLALSLLYALFSLRLKADFIVVGIGVNILAAGASVFLLQVIYGNPGKIPTQYSINLPQLDLGPIGQIPVLGTAINHQTPLMWLALLAVPAYSWVLFKTRFGVHLRSVGEDPAAAAAAGIDVGRVKFAAILIAGVLCGLAGAQLAMATLGTFVANMTSGRGFIAVAALTFGRGRPLPTLIAALLFGTADAVADQLGVAGVNPSLALMTPYVITILALTLAGIDIGRRARLRRAVRDASVA